MSYQGYLARIEYDERDNVLIGRVLGLRDSISFEGENLSELRRDFEAAINHYLSDCAERGIAPEKQASGRMMLRVPPEIHGAALIAAQASGKSLNQWATELFRQAAR